MNRHQLISGVWIISITLLLSSCSGTSNIQFQRYLEQSSCQQSSEFRYSYNVQPQPIHTIKLDSGLIQHFSFTSLQAANAIGLLSMLTDYVSGIKQYKHNGSIENRLNILELSNKINQRINMASLEISSVASELDCEEERITQIADYMKNRESEKETRLTVAAIIIGATGAATSALVLNNSDGGDNIADYIGVASGIAEATVGLMILLNKQKVELKHSRNALREIWEGHDTSSIFPSSLWYYINYYNPDDQTKPSLRYHIIERWMSFKQIEKAQSRKKRKLIDLYFGNGGKYTTDQLYNRANMYDQLESYIKLIKQDLMVLSREIENINNK